MTANSISAQSNNKQEQEQENPIYTDDPTSPDFVEPILRKSLDRYCLFPIKYHDLWASRNLQLAKHWTANEIDYVADKSDWESLSDDERFFIEHVLAFFANSDSIVMENISTNFAAEIQIPEAISCYAIQNAMEDIHVETYARLIDTFIEDENRKKELFNAISTIPCVAKKASWALKWRDSSRASFAERIVAFAVVEGVFFSGSFCSIFWLKSRGKMVKALGHSNEFIARDEATHCHTAILMYNLLVNKLDQERIHEIFREAVEIEAEFINEAIPCRLIGMNSDLMTEYIKFVANYWLARFGCAELYPNVSNPFDFMVMNELDGKSNFFEKRPSEYTKSHSVSDSSSRILKLDNNDF